MTKTPKSEFLQIRLTIEDREKVAHIAASEYLEASTWARRVILKAIEDWEAKQETKK